MPILAVQRSSRVLHHVVLLGSWLVTSLLVGQSPPQDAPPPAQGQSGAPAPLPDGNEAVNSMNIKYIVVHRTIMTPKNVADTFGRRIAKRYIAMQIAVANRSKD